VTEFLLFLFSATAIALMSFVVSWRVVSIIHSKSGGWIQRKLDKIDTEERPEDQ
jgi:hypothetical protein